MPNLVVINNKGGVGKSTLSQQIAATYNLAKTGAAVLVELDDQNHDAAGLTETAIKARQQKVGSENQLAQAWAEHAILTAGDTCKIIDVGGNLTSDWFISAISKTPYIAEDYLDAIIIPVIDNGISVQNAEKIYNRIAENPELQAVKDRVIFAINNAASSTFANVVDHPEEFQQQIETRYFNAVNLFVRTGSPYFVVVQMDGVENIKSSFEKTIYEIHQNYAEIRKITDDEGRAYFTSDEFKQTLSSKTPDPQALLNKSIIADKSNQLGNIKGSYYNMVVAAHSGLDSALEKIKEKNKTKSKAAKKSA